MDFDVVFIGGGPGGYVGAIKAAQLGLKTACIEGRGRLGGTCLNVGCIPSKALLTSSHKYHDAKHHFAEHGIDCKDVKVNLDQMMSRKDKVVDTLGKGIEMLFNKNKVTYIKGWASFENDATLSVKLSDGTTQKVTSKNFVVATGSSVISLPGIDIDEKTIVSSTGALSLAKIPGSMLVIGGGVIGLEMASVWSRLGAKVEVVEFADRLVAAMDSDVSKEMKKVLENQGISFKLSTKVTSAKNSKKGVSVDFESVDGASKESKDYDIVLVSVGRKANTDGLEIEKAGITLENNGKVPVNHTLQTAKAHIYAIGDVVAGAMLAHKAEEEGIAVAELLAGQKPHINYDAIPGVVYTHPEAASVGKTEEELKKAGIEYQIGKFPMMANSRARTNGETEGFVKIISTKGDGKILGASIVAANAGELIQELVFAMEFGAAGEDIARISHGHPGLSEAVKEAGFLAAFGKTIHI